MDQFNNDALESPKIWKRYIFVALKFLVTFYIATLCIVVFFIHRGQDWILSAVVLGILYLFIIAVSFAQMIKKLPLAAIVLAAPTVPLIMLILVVSIIILPL